MGGRRSRTFILLGAAFTCQKTLLETGVLCPLSYAAETLDVVVIILDYGELGPAALGKTRLALGHPFLLRPCAPCRRAIRRSGDG